MFDLVPLARARREVADTDGEVQLIRELLEFHFPELASPPVAATTVRSDEQFFGFRIARFPHLLPPRPNARHGELCRIVVDANRDPAFVLQDVVDAVGDGFSQFFVHEVVDVHFHGTALAFHFPSAILEIPDQLFLLRIDGDHRLVTLVTVLHGGGNVAELSIPIRMLLALEALAVALEAVPLGLKQATDRIGTDSVLLRLQCLSDFPHALARPTQIGLWVAPRERIDEFVEIGEKCRVFFREFLATAARTADAAFGKGLLVSIRLRMQFADAGADGVVCESGGFRHDGDATVAACQRFRCRPVTTSTFIERRIEQSVFLPDHPDPCIARHGRYRLMNSNVIQVVLRRFLC